MNKQQLLELTRVNLRYANPQVTNRFRNKGKNGKDLTRSLISQYFLSGLIFLFLYGFLMILTDFSKMPGMFTYYVALFSILAFSQGISVIYNVFFESQDLQAYLPLPFKQNIIFIAKIIVVALTIIPFVLPMFILFILTGWRAKIFIPLSIILAIIVFLLILVIIFSICCLIVFGLTKTSFFKKHKKIVTTLLLVISMATAAGGVLFMNLNTSDSSTLQFDRNPIVIFMPIYRIFMAPFSLNGLLSFGGLVLLVFLCIGAIKLFILPKLYEQLTDAATAKGNPQRKHKANQSISQLLTTYNIQLLKEPNLIMQVLTNSLLFPMIFIISFSIGGTINLSNLDVRFIGVVFLTGVALATLTVNQTSFISTMISLDQENFNFVQSLPFSMHKYMQQKFIVGLVVQFFLTGGIALIAGLLFHLPLLLLLALILGACLGSYLFSLRYFSRDLRLLLLDWTNIEQLFNRGSGSMGLVLTMFLSMIVSIIILVLYGFLAIKLPFWPLNLTVLVLVIGISIAWVQHYQKTFWKKF
ncbi:ABC transporter [Enterococcus sp. LJL99]